VVSTDASVENVHFRRHWLAPEEIGYRSAAVGLSDLAAMAATPVALLTSLILPIADYDDFAARLMAGVARAAAQYGAGVAGGDTTRTDGPLAIDVISIGQSPAPVLRSGAQVGDELWVTGSLGGAAAALAAWQSGVTPSPAARRAFAEPQPRIAPALWLAERSVFHALIDLSDGLVSDAAHLAAASGVGIRLNTTALPIHEAARHSTESLRLALAGGDDYELCFTAAPGRVAAVSSEFESQHQLRLSCIGTVAAGQGVEIVDEQGRHWEDELKGYDHFGVQP